MRRISHDLPGVAQRLAKMRDTLSVAVVETEQIWRDDKGQQFFRQHISHTAPTISGLVSSLTQMIEQFENIAKQVQDPDEAS